jgi:N-formylglutamate deformylase
MHLFQLTIGEGPLVAAAIHNGQFVRPEVARLLALPENERLREEDPFTNVLIEWAPTQFVGARSRYEFDLNRPRDLAVYLKPEHSWGVNIWHEPPSPEVVQRTLANYDLFYTAAKAILDQLVKTYGIVVVLDVHTYNHRRDGPAARMADSQTHPEVNVGTGSMDRQRWAPLVDAFIDQLRQADHLGHRLDVRENVKFYGGNFCRWIHETFPTSVCALAVELKKTFMDEWTGAVDRRKLESLCDALKSTAPRLLQIMAELHQRASSK